MRAYFLEMSGTGTRLAPRDAPVPEEAPGQVLVRVRAAGLNRGEFIVGHGRAKPGAARPAGNEAAAEVARTGDRVTDPCPGDVADSVLLHVLEVLDIPETHGRLEAGEWLL